MFAQIRSCVRRVLGGVAAAVAGMTVVAVQSMAQTPAPADQVELAFLAANPELYATARRYFPGSDAGIAPRRIFRLTRDQIDASVASLLPAYATASIKDVVPKDSLQTNYEYAELLSFNAANISGLSTWIGGIAARVRKDPAGVIDCTTSGNSQTCLGAAARSFVMKAFRGDVSDAKAEQITKFFLNGVASVGINQAASELVEVVLHSPDFLFRKELDVNRSGRLSPAQLLAAITYTLADAPPDALALDAQQAGQHLRSGTEASAAIRAITTSGAAREKLLRFFHAWLEVKGTAEFTISPEVYPDFKPQLAAAMRTETTQFLRAQLGKPNPRLSDITQSVQSFVPKSLEGIYGTPASIAGGKLVNLDPAQRLGIFSQPAVLASHSGPDSSRPIKRGVFWVRKVMCMEMEPPPPDIHAELYKMEGATERQRIEQSTAAPACAGCHKIINPFAFFQESYDALGRFRTTENKRPIDTSILIDFLDEEPAKTTSAVDAIKTLTNSAMFKQCFVRQLFRFYMGRNEEASDDPLLRRMFLEFAHDDNQDILRAIQIMAASDRIVKRQ